MTPADRTLVTVGRAAQMLRVKRQVVHEFMLLGELQAEEPVEAARGARQYVFRKSEIYRFARARTERWRRRPPTYGPQLALPLRAAAPVETKPQPWRIVRPVMMKAGLQKAKATPDDRQVNDPRKTKDSRHVA